MPLTSDEDIAQLLRETRTIAIVGASDRPDRPSWGVAKFLADHGYRIFPVNPSITGEHIHGEYVWRELDQIGDRGNRLGRCHWQQQAGGDAQPSGHPGGISEMGDGFLEVVERG